MSHGTNAGSLSPAAESTLAAAGRSRRLTRAADLDGAPARRRRSIRQHSFLPHYTWLVNDPLSALVVGLLVVLVVAGAVMLIANRMPGKERWVRLAFCVVLAVFFGLIGFYVVGGLIGGYGGIA